MKRCFLLAGLAISLWFSGRPLAGQTESGPNLPAQPIGPSDLLAITVYGAPELTRSVRVGEDGLIRLPMVREKIEANGLMPAELEISIAEALATAEILVDPFVSVAIAEYHSHPIDVGGAVKSPLTFQSTGKTTLLEALGRAQGLADSAGPEILVTRKSLRGEPDSVERVPVKGLIDAADPSLNLVLNGGEEIRVPAAGRIFILGNVKKPGSFRSDEGSGMTVLKALAMAEGLAPYASTQAYIFRKGDGKSEEVPVPLRGIMDRKAPDIALNANDILFIPDHRAKRITMTALDRAIGFASSTASGALILGVNR